MIAPLSLTALLVDDKELIYREYREALENIDIGLRYHSNNEEALKALEGISALQLPLHLIITDIVRPDGPRGLDFIERIRTASRHVTVGGGLRVRYLPLIVISGNVTHYIEQVKRIDAAIPVHNKPIWQQRLIQIIVDALADYRAKILSELQHYGVAVEWKDGLYRVLPAYGAKHPELIETDRFAGTPGALSTSYTALCLIKDRGAIARFYLDQFEQLLNSPRVRERDMQAFLERHPEFILGGQFDSYWSQPQLRTGDSKILKPDFLLQPTAELRSTAWNWQLLDLKSPRAPLMPKSRFHQTLTAHVTKVVEQLKDYGEYFADPRHRDEILRRFGGVIPRPKLVALIGRLPNEDSRERYTTLRTRLTDVTLTTYDEILEFRRTRVQQIEAALSPWKY